jgi:hypothetical protein
VINSIVLFSKITLALALENVSKKPKVNFVFSKTFFLVDYGSFALKIFLGHR